MPYNSGSYSGCQLGWSFLPLKCRPAWLLDEHSRTKYWEYRDVTGVCELQFTTPHCPGARSSTFSGARDGSDGEAAVPGREMRIPAEAPHRTRRGCGQA